MNELKYQLYRILQEKGAALVGTADLSGMVKDHMKVGISVAVPVPERIVEDLKTSPTREYYEMYYTLNDRLNHIVEAGAEFLAGKGYQAYANTTQAVEIDSHMRTPLPHKTVATKAGLGWIGKNCLLVTKEYGSAVRLSSLVTDAPIPTDDPVTQSRCGSCNVCVEKCPARALTGVEWKPGMPREELLRNEICKKVQEERMRQFTGIDTDLCGMCFAVCTYTQRYLNQKHILD